VIADTQLKQKIDIENDRSVNSSNAYTVDLEVGWKQTKEWHFLTGYQRYSGGFEYLTAEPKLSDEYIMNRFYLQFESKGKMWSLPIGISYQDMDLVERIDQNTGFKKLPIFMMTIDLGVSYRSRLYFEWLEFYTKVFFQYPILHTTTPITLVGSKSVILKNSLGLRFKFNRNYALGVYYNYDYSNINYRMNELEKVLRGDLDLTRQMMMFLLEYNF
jgi:hypothetical protein